MQAQVDYITDLARQYRFYAEDSNALFDALNRIPLETVEHIRADFGDTDRKFQPVRLLRAEVSRLRLTGAPVTKAVVEEIKEKIRSKNITAFPHLPAEYVEQMAEYAEKKRDIFANWQRDWSVFHTFFYRSTTKETTQLYLQQICRSLLNDLAISDYVEHYVDFYGASNFGADYCWLALYPANKESHKESFQFFIKFEDKMEVGQVSGSNLRSEFPSVPSPHRTTKNVTTYDEALDILKSLRPEILLANEQIRNYFKYAPGENAHKWEEVRSEGVVATDYGRLPVQDISEVRSMSDLNTAAGFPADSKSNLTWNLWLLRNANVGDVVFASRGTMTCIGIGLIKGDYYYDPAADFRHRRKVEWITDKVYQYEPYRLAGCPRLFRTDAFSPTKVHDFILSEYVRLYPELREVFKHHNLTFPESDSSPGEVTDSESHFKSELDGGQGERQLSYWWLVANPAIWTFSKHEVGGHQTYTSKNLSGNKRRIFRNFEEVQPGDLLIGYESSPTKQIKAVCEVTRGLHTSMDQGEVFEFEVTEKLDVPIYLNELQQNSLLSKSEPFANNLQGSLFRLSEDEYDLIREIIAEKNVWQEAKLRQSFSRYRFSDDPDKPFMPEQEFQHIVDLLRRKKNVILQGPPGVGKTFLARKFAYEAMGFANDAQIEFVQFHQSFAYEDFIQGYRPSKGSFVLKNGVFFTFCQQAAAHPARDFFFIIDEINRGNLSKILGEMMMLIEADKRDPTYAIKLTYAEDEEDRFFVPPNVHIIGTMNTADRSLAIVDYALRRRFAFVPIRPGFGTAFENILESMGVSRGLVGHIRNSVGQLNDRIVQDPNLGEGFQIGHSFFCTKSEDQEEITWWSDIVTFEIAPYVREIYFDNEQIADELITVLAY